MVIKEIGVSIDQNVPVFDDNRFLTMRVGVSLKAEVDEAKVEEGARELHAKASELLDRTLAEARAQAASRLERLSAAIRDEKEIL